MSAVRHWHGTVSNIRLGDLARYRESKLPDGSVGKQVADEDDNRQGHAVYVEIVSTGRKYSHNNTGSGLEWLSVER